MRKDDLVKLIGAEGGQAEYEPVACLLKSGHACCGYYNSALNRDLLDTVVLVNALVMPIAEPGGSGMPDFSDFLEDVASRYSREQDGAERPANNYGRSVPLCAIPLDELAIVYPVAQIGKLLELARGQEPRVPAFFDLDNRSLILKLLRTKLW